MGVVPQPCCCARRSIEDDIFSKACSGCIARIALHLVGILYCAAACCPCTRQSRLLFIVLLSAALAHVNQGSSLCVNSREARINFLSRKKEPASRRVIFFSLPPMASNSVFSELLRGCKLDGSNFSVWKRKIMYLLTAENIDYVIDIPEPEKPNNDASNEEKGSYLLEYEAWLRIIKGLAYLY
ncbi:hypothetical protein PVAP13_4NG148300 [Panicum virgatum]|uniref:Uncharacterized protein n=1 Tax=Panicum virgatum TaxID=38727 RepID=A0A8T0TDL5_PANVG|nr:hypothetical protein PVAP13_4NG148300 [Panicum virgatum]